MGQLIIGAKCEGCTSSNGGQPWRISDGQTAAVIERLGWSVCGPGEWKRLGDWMVARALEHDAPSVLFRQAVIHLRSVRIVRPGLNRLMRAVATARDGG